MKINENNDERKRGLFVSYNTIYLLKNEWKYEENKYTFDLTPKHTRDFNF